jgi:beta-phosphoglucomutase-like phosphatase (HAD superfamily)
LIFDFDGVLVDSEYLGNKHVADYLTARGHPIGVREAMDAFMGLSGPAFIDAIERWIGKPLPDDFHSARREEDARVLRDGVAEVAGAIAFVDRLPTNLPRAIASSSSPEWIRTHLDHLGIRNAFEPHIYSGKVNVARGKPAPDLYHYAADALEVPIERTAVIEDSPVGVTGAVASGATVIGLAAGRHCYGGHAERLRALGAHHVAHSFEEVAALLA